MPEFRPPLDGRFRSHAYDPLDPVCLLQDEVAQRRETGYRVDDVVAAANELATDDVDGILALVDGMSEASRDPEWKYDEPSELGAIREAQTESLSAEHVPAARRADGIRAAWLGRIAGCNVGKPVELGHYWTRERLRAYLGAAGAYPLNGYIPVLDPPHPDFVLCDNWPETTLGNIDGSARDDDIDYSILTLHLLEQHGRSLTTGQIGAAWMRLLPITQTYTAERAAYANLVAGIAPPRTAVVRNPYREWIGAQIRGDVYGLVFAGDPESAAHLAYRDARLSHRANGIYGEMWVAALVAAAFVSATGAEALARSLPVVPARSRLAEALNWVRHLHNGGWTWDEAVTAIRERFDNYAWVHTVNNAAVVTAALLWSDGDVATAIGRAVMSGWDTDSNGATVGAVSAILTGTEGLPKHLVDPLRDTTRSALFGFDNSRISVLAERTVRLAEDFAAD